MKRAFENIKWDRFSILLFAMSTAFFLYQHSRGISWDFTAYVLNAKHIFADSPYFGWLSPPLAPFILGMFGFLGWTAAEYAYIVFVSALFFYATRTFSSAFKMDNGTIYAILLGPFVLVYGTLAGTELLSLSMLMLFAASLANKAPLGAAYLSLAVLARYQNAIFLPMILLYRQPKRIAFAAIFFLITQIPWLAYNYVETGSIFTSIADTYALNISYRQQIQMPFRLESLFIVLSYLLPIAIAGLAIKARKIDASDAIHLAMAAGALYFFMTVPTKEARYLLNLTLPAAYFAYFAIRNIRSAKYVFVALGAAALILASVLYPSQVFPESGEKYRKPLQYLDDCAVLSNGWIFLNYYGLHSEGAPWERRLKEKISNGYRAVFFKNIPEPEYAKSPKFNESYPVIRETRDYLILGNKSACAKSTERLDKTFIELSEPANSPCRMLFPKLHDSLCSILK